MNSKKNFAVGLGCAMALLAAMAVLSTFACSSNNSKSVSAAVRPAAAQPVAHVQPVVLKSVEPADSGAAAVESAPSVEKRASEPLTFRSRDYGISFVYPWQYAFVNARTMANGEDALQPKSDGSDGQFPLARVEIPAGFYPDTDFESGYFTVSLNQDLSEEQCAAAFAPADAKAVTEKINGVEFRRVDSETGGGGAASMVRSYAAYTNGTCYEVEMGVTTRNDRGLAREVSTEQVFRRLNAILETVNIAPAMKKAEVSTASVTPQP